MKLRPSNLPDIDAVLEGDRRFFERFPDRRHRVRIASPAEIETLKAAVRRPLHLPGGCQYLTAVRCVGPGVRARVFLYATTDAPTDLPEEVAASIFRNTLHGTGAVLDERGVKADIAVTDSYAYDNPEDICPRLDYPDEEGGR